MSLGPQTSKVVSRASERVDLNAMDKQSNGFVENITDSIKNILGRMSPAKSHKNDPMAQAAEISVAELSIGEIDNYDVPSDEEETGDITRNMKSFVQK